MYTKTGAGGTELGASTGLHFVGLLRGRCRLRDRSLPQAGTLQMESELSLGSVG